MRTCVFVSVLVAAVAGSTLSTLSGCASSEPQREDVREAAGTLRQSMKKAPAQIDATMNALYQATSGDNTNRASRYNAFKSQLVILEEDARFIRQDAQKARADAAKYFKQWASESVAADPSKSTQMTPVMEGRVSNYETALTYLDGGRDAYQALLTDLNDIKKALDANLNDANSAAVGKKVQAAKVHSVDLKNYIAVLSDRIDTTLAKK